MTITKVIVQDLYPLIEKTLSSRSSKLQACIAKFINDRHSQLFDIAPYDRIYFNQSDLDDLWKALDLKEEQIIAVMKKAYFWDIPINPQCVKEPYVMTLMMCIRYYLKKNQTKYAELTSLYLAFSGKFYASLHAGVAFPSVSPAKYKTVMDFVINNMLTDKFDLKKEGTVFGAVMSLCKKWLETYGAKLKATPSDEDLKTIVQQLRDRERSFLMNIAKLYYEAWENRNFLNYETDSLDEDNFHLTSNDAASAARYTENAMNVLTSTYVSIDICDKCQDSNVKAREVREIMEGILGDKNNLPKLRRIINIIICDYLRNYPGGRVGDIEFVVYSLKAKPNTKDPIINELKSTILSWLDENSPNYRKRRSRKATAASYYKSILMYLVLVINKVSR
jgi:hypothetical protein